MRIRLRIAPRLGAFPSLEERCLNPNQKKEGSLLKQTDEFGGIQRKRYVVRPPVSRDMLEHIVWRRKSQSAREVLIERNQRESMLLYEVLCHRRLARTR